MKFIKKPIMIEAEKFEMLSGIEGDVPSHPAIKWWPTLFRYGYYLETFEGWMRVYPGYWIVEGIAGELYGVRPDIFEATYEAVT